MNEKVSDTFKRSAQRSVHNPQQFQSNQASGTNVGAHERGNSYTEEVVSLLEERIERRMSWDHDMWMFSAPRPPSPIPEHMLHHGGESGNQSPIRLGVTKGQIIPQTEPSKEYRWTSPMRSELQALQIAGFQSQQRQQIKSINEKKQNCCNCHKSKCLKMYCPCFRKGSLCSKCSCQDCGNSDASLSKRKQIIATIKKKEPTAFLDVFQYKGCNCTKTHCNKGYCDCYRNGLMCGKYCNCLDCFNKKKNKGKTKRRINKSKNK